MACATISLKRSLDSDPLSPRRLKRRRCQAIATSPSTSVSPSKPPSIFKDATPSMSKENIAQSIRCEIKRLQHRKQLMALSSSDSNSDTELAMSTSQISLPHTNQQSPTRKDNTPLFTFKQVSMLCEKMVKEREDELCEQYDKVLANKLSEQYEAFLKFNHDQLQRHFSTSSDASYLS